MTTLFRLTLAALVAATTLALTVTGATSATGAPPGASGQLRTQVGTDEPTTAQARVSARRAERFAGRYFRHVNQREWRWVRQHSSRRMREEIPWLRSMRAHGRFGSDGDCQPYVRGSNVRVCAVMHDGSLVGEIHTQRRADGSMRMIRFEQYR